MSDLSNIQDVWVRDIIPEKTADSERLKALRFDEHVLRRFGSLDVIRLAPRSSTVPLIRYEADEVWVLVEGSVECNWRDARESSPTFGGKFMQKVVKPAQIFVPFGVAFGLQADIAGATMLRISTHEQGDNSLDKPLSWDDLLED